jgi:hypothetical protein
VELPAPALSYAPPRPTWRTAAIVAGAIAAVELVVLVVVALAFIAKPFAHDGGSARTAQARQPAAKVAETGAPAPAAAEAPAVAKLPRSKTAVLVLNGNGVAGAASRAAQRVEAMRYPVARIADASRRDFPRTIVMYRPGLRGEAERLARDLGLGSGSAVPLDGMSPADLSGARLALIVGG